MQRCIELAHLGLGKVSPNPLVGSIIVFEGTIIGEGWHQGFGLAHAEVNAIKEALIYLNNHFPDFRTESSNSKFSQTVLYVNLEPCSHFGKTPPCSDLIIFHGINKVVIGTQDPNPLVGGRGIQKLKEAGVEILLGILERDCQRLNRRFFTSIKEKRPYIILKWAETMNGYMAPLDKDAYWISSPLSQRLNHQWRTEEDAILIGTKTAIQDNPKLTSRFWVGKNPKRILIDWDLKVPISHHIYDESAETIIINGHKSEKSGNITQIHIENREYLVQFMLYEMHLNDIGSVIVEGGSITLEKFLELNLWDEIRLIKSDTIYKTGIRSPLLPEMIIRENYSLDGDQIVIGFNPRSTFLLL